MKPNYHYATHIPEQILDYGPVYGFWAFPSERLNKTVKSFNTNNHRGGELELCFMRELFRAQRTQRLVRRSSPR